LPFRQHRLSPAAPAASEQLVVLERTAWADTATTAAEVTALQTYRDLFADEALRGGRADLGRDADGRLHRSARLDPVLPRGRRRTGVRLVLQHLDVLREAVADEGGSVVKAMGDAIMAVFQRPIAAVRAMHRAQEVTAGKPLALKVGIHTAARTNRSTRKPIPRPANRSRMEHATSG
jgi:adenylate cyclase